MQNPYIVGRWVRGCEHYDRQGLTDYLLGSQDTAIWVMGTRRMGKTSLLRHLEHITTTDEESPFIPLFWDLQGCVSLADLNQELTHAVEDVADRFEQVGLCLDECEQLDAIDILRRLNRRLTQVDRQLLLLVDEAEVLVAISQQEPAWLARLRKVFQEGRQRTIIASTRLLTTMTERSVDWVTSPFLFGFHLVNLHTLERKGAEELVRQAQGNFSVHVEPDVVAQVLAYTDGHPYLIQWLCQRLFVPIDDRQGYLRAVEPQDVVIDALMASFFQVDIRRMTFLERRMLLAVAQAEPCRPEILAARMGQSGKAVLDTVIRSLEELGHLRREGDNVRVGNEFLRCWLVAHWDALWAELAADEAAVQADNSDEIAQLAKTLGVAPERIRNLIGVKISTNEEFFRTIQGFFIEIRHLVEQDDGHRLLLTASDSGEPTLRSEEDVQIALKHWLRPMCRALNIHMDREPLTGRGLLDFKFSFGHDFRCMVEVKLFSNTRLQDGLAIQLPIYLMADHSTYGLYVPIFLESPGYAAMFEKLMQAARQQSASHGVHIEVVDIRAWKLKSASRADSVDEFARYRLPHGGDDDG